MEFGGQMSNDNISNSTVLIQHPVLAIIYITILTVATLSGTLGNLLVIASLLVLITRKRSRYLDHGYAFIFNLACSDLVVTALINPFAVLGVVYGADMYAGHFGLCRFLASICIISCVVSLLSIGCIAANRYLYICHYSKHSSIITRHTSIALCVFTWMVGVLLDLPNHLFWSTHTFDLKAQKCLWDRNNYYYSVFFVSTGMLLPLGGITIMYMLVFIKVSVTKSRIGQQVHHSRHSIMMRAMQKTRMMFVVFAAFVACWLPYIYVLLTDRYDTLSLSLHLYVSLIAHLHASVNFLIYGVCNKQIRSTYKLIILRHVLRRQTTSVLASSTSPPHDTSVSRHSKPLDTPCTTAPIATSPMSRSPHEDIHQETMSPNPASGQNKAVKDSEL